MTVTNNITIKNVQGFIEDHVRKTGISRERGLDVFLDYLIEFFDISAYKHGEEGRTAHIERMKEKSEELLYATLVWLVVTDRMMHTEGWWDSLGTLYEEMYQSKGKASGLGQFFTPKAICDLMARSTATDNVKTIVDPACGSGRTLMAMCEKIKAAEGRQICHGYFIGQDIDIMSVKMCAINMMINNMHGRAVRTDTLKDPNHFDIGWEINEANYPFPCGCYSLRRIHYTEEDEKKYKGKQILIRIDMKIDEKNPVYKAIKGYLDKRAEADELFAKAYANKDKSINECINFVIGEAKKRGGAAVMMTDDEVYGLAVHYYDEKDIKVTDVSDNVEMTASAPEAPNEELAEKYHKMSTEAHKLKKVIEKPKPKKEAKKAEAKEGERGFVGNLFDML